MRLPVNPKAPVTRSVGITTHCGRQDRAHLTDAANLRVAVLAGGFGGARMAHGFALLGDPVALTVIVNTGDDLELHGLYISPDLDTVMYTLAGLANQQTGWGVRDETWSATEMMATYGQPTWFRLGDRDLATHIVRTARLRAGESLTEVTHLPRRSASAPGFCR